MTYTFDYLQIHNFRGLRTIELSGLGQVNLLVGMNNSGKTSLLEAIAILCNPLDPFQWLGTSQRRPSVGRSPLMSRPDPEALKWLFSQTDNFLEAREDKGIIAVNARGSAPINGFEARLSEIYGSGTEEPNQTRLSEDDLLAEAEYIPTGVEIEVLVNASLVQQELFASGNREVFQFWENERFVSRKKVTSFVKYVTISPSYSSSELISALRLTRVIKEHAKDEVLEVIRWLDSDIQDIQILSTSSARSSLYIEHRKLGLAPFYAFGDGLKRALIIALTLSSTRGGVLLIDEVETSIHVSAFSQIFLWLVEACKRREIQLFITTHSLEAIDAMLQTSLDEDNIVAFRLNADGKPPQRFSGDLLHRLRSERGLDVR